MPRIMAFNRPLILSRDHPSFSGRMPALARLERAGSKISSSLPVISYPFDLPGFIDSLKYHENEKEITYSYPCDCNQYCPFLLCFRGSNLKGRLPSDPGICRIRKSLNITDPTIFEVTNFGNLFDLY